MRFRKSKWEKFSNEWEQTITIRAILYVVWYFISIAIFQDNQRDWLLNEKSMKKPTRSQFKKNENKIKRAILWCE